jgi:uncharacterized cupin superfamily protein
MPRLDLEAIPQANTTKYPDPFDKPMAGRWFRRLAPASGLTAMGASHVVLKPGGWSSQRHWHADEDELLVMLSGEAVLVEDGGRTVLRAGDICAWPKGVEDGHHLINESDHDCSFIAISAGDPNGNGAYSDIDMQFRGTGYFRKDGTPYPPRKV